MENANWYEPLRAIRSLGSQKEKIEHMGQLAEARKKHLGQFFTPDQVAAFMWRFVKDLPIRDIMDNSIGSASLLQFADPEKHRLYGVDVHKESIEQVKSVISEAGFECEILCAGMQDIRPRNMCVAIINPPFSIHLESPTLKSFYGCTRMGRFGPDTSATSDEYAVFQALSAAAIVVALLPRSSADAIRQRSSSVWSSSETQSRLRAVFDLPANTFKEEGANVLTSVVIFGEIRSVRNCIHITVDDLESDLPDLGLLLAAEKISLHRSGTTLLNYQRLDCVNPSITLPVTGNNEVRISLDGRKIRLAYQCGFTQARVQNAILGKRVFSTEHHRLPKGIKYSGQGKLDVEVYLIQDEPMKAFDEFLELIVKAKGIPVLHSSVRETLQKKITRNKRSVMPLKHTIWSRGAGNADRVTGIARKSHNVNPSKFISPVIKGGEEMTFDRQPSGLFMYEKSGQNYTLTADDLEARFELQGATQGWKIVHTGLLAAYPQQAGALLARVKKLGIDKWLTWDFQVEDAIEVTCKPKGTVIAWKQACGKSRLAAALIMLSGMRHGLIVVESRLVSEMLIQLNNVNVDMSEVTVIDCPEKLNALRKFNIISYERLRLLVDPMTSKRITYSHKLRRRIGVLVADEGERLANLDSSQSRALFEVSAKKRYILTGTPIANYPRNAHGLMAFVGGDCTPAQPYGVRRGYLEKNWINSMEFAERGLNAIRKDFVVMEWCSHEFAESLTSGAKREIPKIANVEKFRAWLAPLTKRRVTNEPEVSKFICLPSLEFETVNLEWDADHLSLYLRAADDFAEWYRSPGEDRRNNLALLLAKLQAVQKALNTPQSQIDGLPWYTGMTSKQRAVLARLVDIAGEGKKALLYAENPAVIDLFHSKLAELGYESVRFHGGITIKKRVADKDAQFINGKVPFLLATKGSAKSGYNIPIADVVLFYDRSWSARVESQAMLRPLRTERKLPVKVIYFHLPGSLDEYQAQMVAFKQDSADAALDWATPEMDDQEFLHLATILNKFVDDLAKLRGLSPHAMRDQLKAA